MNIHKLIACAQSLLTGRVLHNCINRQLCYENRQSEQQRVGTATKTWLWERWQKACKQQAIYIQLLRGEETAGIDPQGFPQPERVYGPQEPGCAGLALVGLKTNAQPCGQSNDR